MKYDVIIIGAGIAGITAALYLKRANKKVLIIEKSIPGGAINKTSSIKNFPGINEISGPDFATNLYNQLISNKIDLLFKTVLDIKILKKGQQVILNDQKLTSKYLIIATGKENRKLNVPNEKELTGHGISYCALCDGTFFKGLDVAVIGSGESAIKEALYLSDLCNRVTILVKYATLKCQNYLLKEVNNRNNVVFEYNSVVTSFVENDKKLDSILYQQNNVSKELKVKGAFIYIGSTPNIFANLDLKLDNNYIVVDKNMATSIDGIYAVGDVIKKDLYQLVTASSEGAVAASSIIKELNAL